MVGARQANSANRGWLALTNTHPLSARAWEFFNLTLQHPKNKEKHHE
jgi:hypothetical protein